MVFKSVGYSSAGDYSTRRQVVVERRTPPQYSVKQECQEPATKVAGVLARLVLEHAQELHLLTHH